MTGTINRRPTKKRGKINGWKSSLVWAWWKPPGSKIRKSKGWRWVWWSVRPV